MGIDYKFNQWRVSGEKAPQWSQKAYKLLKVNLNKNGYTGELLGVILYLYFVKGMTVSQIMDMLNSEPKMLDILFIFDI